MSEFSRSENWTILQRNREQEIHASINFLFDFLSAYWNPSYRQQQQPHPFAKQFTGLGTQFTNKQDGIKRRLRQQGAEPWENASPPRETTDVRQNAAESTKKPERIERESSSNWGRMHWMWPNHGRMPVSLANPLAPRGFQWNRQRNPRELRENRGGIEAKSTWGHQTMGECQSLSPESPMPRGFQRNRQRNQGESRENRAGIEAECTGCDETMGECQSPSQIHWRQGDSSGIDQETRENWVRIEEELRQNGPDDGRMPVFLTEPSVPRRFQWNRQRNPRELRENRGGIEAKSTGCEQTTGECQSLSQNRRW